MKYVFVFALVIFSSVVRAQTPPEFQALNAALNAKLGSEVGAGVQCNAGLFVAQARIADLEKQLADLKKPADAPK